ncbi:SH3 domain-containing protein [Acetobacteraceae bacterium KSS8]|uniref:SH3 domain-containing protein n=1 Tax=Endosaccharibacter trunci TaxID=2812733 RepID=A0ABT1WA08_9PROT|nr:SH3 domain-containing protein [Acetobacteraceae bacterium KSS8]
MKKTLWLGVAAMALLAGCKPAKTPAAESDAGNAAGVVAAAEDAVRGALPNAKSAEFRGVQSYDQALADRRAVCGQVSPYPDDPALFVPFVAVMQRDAKGGWTSPGDARFIGTSVAEADRTYLALVVHCYDKGGPSDGPVQNVAPIPPVPNEIPHPSEPAAPPPASTGAPPPAAGAAANITPASGTVTLRQNANLHDTPQGASVRVVPQGTALHVFGTAPGGWYQVGDDAPWGWVHQSMLDGPPH